jgi:uncharacterized protein YqfA (UPF0365 family)
MTLTERRAREAARQLERARVVERRRRMTEPELEAPAIVAAALAAAVAELELEEPGTFTRWSSAPCWARGR